jgi:hypothetical protein
MIAFVIHDLSGSRMKFSVDLLQTFASDMGVDLCSRDIGVAQHKLNSPEISPILEKVCGKTVAEHMRSQWFGNSGFDSVASQNFPESLTRHV